MKIAAWVEKQFKRRPKVNSSLDRSKRTTSVDKPWYTPELRQLKGRLALLNDLRREATNNEDRAALHASYLRLNRIYRDKVLAAKKIGNAEFIEQAQNPCKAA